MSNFSKVGIFMKTFGQEVKDKPSFSTDKINKLRIDLIKEELDELKEAMVKLKLILGISSKTNITEYFNKFLKDMDIAFDLSADFNLTDDEKLILSKSVNQERLLNNPVVFNEAQINKIFNLFYPSFSPNPNLWSNIMNCFNIFILFFNFFSNS